MYGALSSENLSEALVRAGQHWEQRRAVQEQEARLGLAVAPTIAISRQTGARGTSVARQVGARLGWPVYDHELLEQIAREMNVRVSLLESIDERVVPWLEERVEAFASVPHVSENTFFRHLVETVLSLGQHGHSIIVGRGANFLLPARTTLRVRLVGELEDRITFMAAELGLSRDQAARHIRDTDQQRQRFVKEHFRVDVGDPLEYDLTLNASRLSVNECASLIVSAFDGMRERLASHAEASGQPAAGSKQTSV